MRMRSGSGAVETNCGGIGDEGSVRCEQMVSGRAEIGACQYRYEGRAASGQRPADN